MLRERPDALVVALDGVLRVFDPDIPRDIEKTYGLADGQLLSIGLRWGPRQQVITGRVTVEAWREAVVVALVEEAGLAEKDAVKAVAAWQRDRGRVDSDVLAFIRDARAAAVPVGLVANATARLDAELTALRLVDEVDVVVNSSVIGWHKPTREFFHEVCVAVRHPPARCLFVDEDDRAVRGARVAGLSAYRWSGPADLPYLRAALTL